MTVLKFERPIDDFIVAELPERVCLGEDAFPENLAGSGVEFLREESVFCRE